MSIGVKYLAFSVLVNSSFSAPHSFATISNTAWRVPLRGVVNPRLHGFFAGVPCVVALCRPWRLLSRFRRGAAPRTGDR